MSIPVATTTVTIQRRDDAEQATRDPWEDGYADEPAQDNPFTTVATGLRAVISSKAGRQVGPGTSEVVAFEMLSDPVDLTYLDQVVDDVTGAEYQVEWSITSPGVAGTLSSTRAGLTTRKGA